MRESLKQFCAAVVQIKGIYQGPAKGHTKPVWINPVNDLPQNAQVKALLRVTPATMGPDSELLNYDETSLLTNVCGIGEFGLIQEDHIIIQGKVDAEMGEEVIIQGFVYKYEKGSEIDYGIKLEYPQKKRC